ncbi:MAG: acyl-CoA dehydrogenase family protein, partial [Angustibacter sp.]
IFITNGGSADLILLAASTDPALGARGITLFGVLADAPGFERVRLLDKVGQDEADTAELSFAGVRVPDAHRLGEVNAGFGILMQHLVAERMGAAAANIAHVDQILRETVDYVKQREAFGQPIGSFQHNKFRLAESATKVSVTQAFVDQCLEFYATGELSAADAAKAKWWSAQVQNEVIDDCVQLHGGYGYLNEYRVARAWRDARVTKIWAGSNEIMKEIIGRDLGLSAP